MKDAKVLHSRYVGRLAALALAVVAVAVVSFLSAVGTAQAHGHTSAGDYSLVIGFHNEPAYQGEPNGLDLTVTNTKTNAKVTGLASTLKAEIIYGDSKKTLKLVPQWGQEGAYTAYVLPTQAGNYTWHIFGTIEKTPVDVTMTSGQQTFGAVQQKSAVTFPSAEPSALELAEQVSSATRLAQFALAVGILGLLVGAAGVYYGARSRNRDAASTRTSPDKTSVEV